MKVTGGPEVQADIANKGRKAYESVFRWLIKASNIVRAQSQWWIRSGQPGYFTGTVHNSIGFQVLGDPKTAVKFVSEIGPGMDTRGGRGLNEKEAKYAFFIHQGFRRHFVPFAGNELLQIWARRHGLIKGNIATSRGGGLMVGGPNSVVGRGLQYMFKGWLSSEAKVNQSFNELKQTLANDLR